MNKNYNFELVENFDSFCILEEEWDDLVKNHKRPSIFLTHSWTKSWLEACHYKDDLKIMIAKDNNNKMIFIAPLITVERYFLKYIKMKTIEFIGSERADYCDFIYEPDNDYIVKLFLKEIQARYPKIISYFNNIPSDSPSRKILDKFINDNRLKTKLICDQSSQVNLSQITEKNYKKKNTKNLLRRLEKVAPVKFKIITEEEEYSRFLEILISQHKSKWGQNSLFNDRTNKNFYLRLFNNFAKQGYLNFTVLIQKKEILALHFGFSFQNIFYYYKPTYNKNFLKYSPGNILLQKLIQSSKLKGFSHFDLGKGYEKYKSRYSTSVSSVFAYAIPAKSLLNRSICLFHFSLYRRRQPLLNTI